MSSRNKIDPNSPVFYVYGIFIDDIPIYIGKGVNDRLESHFKEAERWQALTPEERSEIRYSKRNRKINFHKVNLICDAWNSNKRIEIKKIKEGLTDKVAKVCEIMLIAFYGRYDRHEGNLTNWTDGGDGVSGYVYSDEQRIERRMRRLGKKNSPETIEKVRQVHLGRKRSEETKKRISESKKGKSVSIEAKENMRKSAKRGKDNHMFRGYYKTPKGIFDSLEKASRSNGCSVASIKFRCTSTKPISHHSVSMSKDLSIEEHGFMIGGYWIDFGWSFISGG